MKTIFKLEQDEKITHKGDLTIESDVGENAELLVEDGNIIINGNVHNHAKITLKISEEKKAQLNANMNQALAASGLGGIISGGSIRIGGKITIGKSISCNGMAMNMGNKSVYLPSPGMEVVTVNVNGKKYQGQRIEMVGDDIIVDGKQMQESVSGPVVIGESLPKLSIEGSVMNNVTLVTDSDIEIKGKVGQSCSIECASGEFTANIIGEKSVVKTRNAIKVTDAGNGCSFASAQYGLTADSLGEDVVVNVRDAIIIHGDVGSHSKLQSQQYGLTARNLAESVNVTVRDAVKVRNIGANSVINSAQYGLNAHDVKENVYITVRDAVTVNSVGNDSHITSAQYGIEVNEQVGNDVELVGRDTVSIGGSVGNDCKLTSNMDKVSIHGSCGRNATINARDAVKVKDVGDDSKIVSNMDEVKARNLGTNVSISARDDITINGSCPDDARLHSKTGKVRKAKVSSQSVFSGNESSSRTDSEGLHHKPRH